MNEPSASGRHACQDETAAIVNGRWICNCPKPAAPTALHLSRELHLTLLAALQTRIDYCEAHAVGEPDNREFWNHKATEARELQEIIISVLYGEIK